MAGSSWRHFNIRRKVAMARRPCIICGDDGATLVETALALTILFVLLFGIFEFSMAFYTYHYVSDAAREGSRWAMVRGSESCTNTPALTSCDASVSDIQNYVKSLAYAGIDSVNRMTVDVQTCPYSKSTASWSACATGTTDNAPGDQVQVTVTYSFPLSIPFWGTKTIPVSSTSTMVYSQ